MGRARYIMVGGFLGAGKTTAMLRLGEHLAAQGVRVGLVTNDQSSGLADTTLLSASGFPVEEITGGCFCCRFNSLTEAAERLTSRVMPDVFLAEPVGSCTDLKATVSYPLRRMYGDDFSWRRSVSCWILFARCVCSGSKRAADFRTKCSTCTANSSKKPTCSSSTRLTRWARRG